MRHLREGSGSLELTALRLPVSPANRVSNQPHDAPESVIPGALFIGWIRNTERTTADVYLFSGGLLVPPNRCAPLVAWV